MIKSLLEVKYFSLQNCLMGYTLKAQSSGKDDLDTESGSMMQETDAAVASSVNTFIHP